MLAQLSAVVSPSVAPREQVAIISFSILKRLHRYCSRSEIVVYNALALHADPEGHCWPGRARLASLTDLSETRVSKATAGLERKGLLRKDYLPGGRIDYWLLDVPSSATATDPPPRVQNGTPPVSKTAPITAQLTAKTPERAATPEPEPPPDPPPAPESAAPALSECRLQARTPLTEDWTLPPAWREWALAQRPDLRENLEAIAQNFSDFHQSKGTRSSCWIAEWRRWIRRERAPRTAVQPRTAPYSDRRYPTPTLAKAPVSAAVEAAHNADVERSQQAFYALCRSQGIDPTTGLRIRPGESP